MATIDNILPRDYSHRDLQSASFKNEDLRKANFSGSDLRGADFSNADLTGADLTHVRTGIETVNVVVLFIAALVISMLSGYLSMRAGEAIQVMLQSEDNKIRYAGIATIVIILGFIVYAWWKGGGNAIRNLIIPVIGVATLLGVIGYLSGAGTGIGMYYQVLILLLVVVMFIVGTIARTAAGSMSNILFLVVALSGGMFAKSLGGGIGTFIIAVACMQISKRALSGAKGFKGLRKLSNGITQKFGTSFRNARMNGVDLSGSKIRNADFTHAEISTLNWGDSKRANCIIIENNGLSVVKQ